MGKNQNTQWLLGWEVRGGIFSFGRSPAWFFTLQAALGGGAR
jgi:hypothetical protein